MKTRCPVSSQDIRAEERAAVGGEERTQTTESRDSTVGRQRLHLQHLQQDLSFENRALQPQPALQLNNRLDQGAISIVSRDRRMPQQQQNLCRFEVNVGEVFTASKKRGERGNAFRVVNHRGHPGHLQSELVDPLASLGAL